MFYTQEDKVNSKATFETVEEIANLLESIYSNFHDLASQVETLQKQVAEMRVFVAQRFNDFACHEVFEGKKPKKETIKKKKALEKIKKDEKQ